MRLGGRRPRVLMATDHDWGGPLNLGSHHLARGFVDAGWDVARISNPISPVHALRDPGQLRRRAGAFALHGRTDLDGRLWAFMPPSWRH